MPNYSFVIGSKFNPLTYDEIVRPLQQATDLQNAYEDALGALEAETTKWENRINKETDKEVYNQYNNYLNELKTQADNLSRYGLNPTSRKDLLNMKRRYASEITPIEEAYATRLSDIERQKKVADATGGRTVFNRDARTTSLGDYINGVEDYKQANLDTIMKEAATGAAAISARHFNTKEGSLFKNAYFDLIQNTGLTPSQALQVLEGDYGNTNQFQDFKDFIERGLNKYSDWGDVESKNKIQDAFMQGINEGIIYKQEHKPLENWMAKEATEYAYKKALAGNMNENTEIPRAFSILTENGELGNYQQLHKDLITENGTLNSEYFGTSYNNPIRIAQQFNEDLNKEKQRIYELNTGTLKEKRASGGNPMNAVRKTPNQMLQEAESKLMDKYKEQYGVTKILTEDQITKLSNIGFNADSGFNAFKSDFENKLNTFAQQYSYNSVNLANYEQADEWLRGNLYNREANDALQNTIWEFNSDGTVGKPIDDLKKLSLGTLKLKDVFYSRQNPDKLLLTLGDGKNNYKRILVDPSVFSDQVRNLIIQSKYLQDTVQDQESKNQIYESTTAQLRALLRGFNKQRTNTDSKLD